MDDRLETALEAMALKDRDRKGWLVRDVDEPESVAAHSWGVGLLTVLFGPGLEVDMERLLALATVHDIAEYRTGDFLNRVQDEDREYSYADKEEAERAAMEALGDDRLKELWEEYEARETREAVVLKDLDLLDMCLQAVWYVREGRGGDGFEEFFEAADQRLSTDAVRELVDGVRDRFERVR